MNRTPYIYTLTFKPQNLVYVGSRTDKSCHPDEFWKSYFTSSKTIEELIHLFGTSDDVWEYKVEPYTTYSDVKEVVTYENKLIYELMTTTTNCLNLMCFRENGEPFTSAGATRSAETRAKMAAAKRGVKREVFNTFDKTVYTFKNKFTLTEFVGTRRDFCQAHNLTKQEVYHVVSGKLKHSKGWGMFLTDKECYSYETPYQSKPQSKVTCPHCNAQSTPGNFKRWHGDNCKLKQTCVAA